MKKLGSVVAIILAVVSLGLSAYLFTEVRSLSQAVETLSKKTGLLQETLDQINAETTETAEEDNVPPAVVQENSANDLVGTWTMAGSEKSRLTVTESGEFYMTTSISVDGCEYFVEVEHGYIDYASDILMFTGTYEQDGYPLEEYYSDFLDVPLEETSGFQTITRYGKDAIGIGDFWRYTRER